MVTKTEFTKRILDYYWGKPNDGSFDRLSDAIHELFEIQAKLISRLNSYHSDLLMLDYDPYLAFDMEREVSLLKNYEVYDLLGIEPPIESIHGE